MSIDDNRPKLLSLPGALVDFETAERGATDAGALTSVKRALADASARPVPTLTAAENADASKRHRLMTEIRMMRRLKPNVAVEGLITGAIWGAIGMAAFHGIKALYANAGRNDDAEPNAAHERHEERK